LVFNLIESGKERSGTCVVAKSFADVGEAVDISRCEDKAATQLKGIGPEFVLMVAGRAGAIAALEIVAPKHVKQIGRTQVGDDTAELRSPRPSAAREALCPGRLARILATARCAHGKRLSYSGEEKR
jgi:hypothetical protein